MRSIFMKRTFMKILSFDIESTTGNHNDGSMCSFGYCLADEHFNIETQEDLVMKPFKPIFNSRVKLHYTKSFIKSQPDFTVFYSKIKSLIAGADYIIGFATINDVMFLNSATEIYGENKIIYSFLDVQLLYKKFTSNNTVTRLEDISASLGIEYEAHRSDEDARVTLLLLKRICEAEGLGVEGVLKKYSIMQGANLKECIEPCSDGTFSKADKRYLISEFKKRNYRHSYFYKGGLTKMNFAFSEEIALKDIDWFRSAIKQVYALNGRISDPFSCNCYVTENYDADKRKSIIEERNKVKPKVKVYSLEEFKALLGEFKILNFSTDRKLVSERHKLLSVNKKKKRATT